jgi:hypothetical protein
MQLNLPMPTRNVALMFLANIVLAVPTVSSFAVEHRPRTLYVAPNPVGAEDGSDWGNAGSLEKLTTFISMAGAGGKVLLKADGGPFRTTGPVVVRNGGSQEAPVTIMGVDSTGRPRKADIIGTRADPWRLNGDQGSEVFRLSTGANNLQFEHISFRNQGNGCFRIEADIQGLEISNVEARNVRRFVENYPGGSRGTATITNFVMRSVVVKGFSKGAIRLQSNSNNVTLEDVYGDSERQDGDNFAIGVALSGTVHNVVLRRVAMMNSHDSSEEYWNGDGFATERGVYNIRFEDTHASGSTDSGYDLKSTDTVLHRVRAEDNKRNFRIWGDSTISDCLSLNPHKRGGNGTQNHFWFAKGAKAEITKCRLVDNDSSTTAFEVAQDAKVRVRNTSIEISASARSSNVIDGGTLDISDAE